MLFAVEYTDMATGKSRKKIPVLIQIAWFRMVYPKGRIATTITPCKDGFVASARIYADYNDGLIVTWRMRLHPGDMIRRNLLSRRVSGHRQRPSELLCAMPGSAFNSDSPQMIMKDLF